MKRALAFLALAILLLAYQRARASELMPASWWVNTGGVSAHDRSGYNGVNPGLGLEARWSDTWAATVGQFRNSERRDSRMLAAIYTPWRVNVPVVGPVHTGALAGMADGYTANQGRAIPIAGLVADRRWDRAAVALVAFPRAGEASAAALVVFFRWRFA